jgi:tRNA threonylcarbamoyladenosine biosynthesis protein TsaE
MLYYRQVETPSNATENRRAERENIFLFSVIVMKNQILVSSSPAATMALGRKTGKLLEKGSVIALIGELGCGKTLLTRGICEGLEVPSRHVNSPTFIFVNEYRGRLPVFHMDMYQMRTESDVVELGITDYLARARTGVMVIEWAEKMLSLLPADFLRVEFQILSAGKRRIEFSTDGEAFSGLFKELRKS